MKRFSTFNVAGVITLSLLFLSGLFLLCMVIVRHEQQVERTKFNDMMASNVDTISVPYYALDSIITNNSGGCVCYNCNNHKWGYVPPISMDQLLANTDSNTDWPEEMPTYGDTIMLSYNSDVLFIGNFHMKFMEYEGYADGCDIFILSTEEE